MLMNVGPTHDGRIIPIFQERLMQMGKSICTCDCFCDKLLAFFFFCNQEPGSRPMGRPSTAPLTGLTRMTPSTLISGQLLKCQY